MNPSPVECWRSADGTFVLHYPPRVLEEIRSEILMAVYGPGRGGIETGGVLLGGPGAPGEYHLTGWRPIRCDHSRGASFLLSARDVAALACQVEGLSGGGTGGVLGWYATHTRGEMGLRAEEQALHGRVFPEQAQLFMIVRPEKFGDAELRFHLITGGAQRSAAAVPGVLRVSPVLGIARPGAPAAIEDAPRVVRAPRPSRRRWVMPAVAAAAALVFATAGWQVWNTPRAGAAHAPSVAAAPPEPAGDPVELTTLHVSPAGDRLTIQWDGLDTNNGGALSATIAVTDQGRTFTRRLTPAELALGRIEYARPTSEIRVLLLVERDGAPAASARAHYSGPPPAE